MDVLDFEDKLEPLGVVLGTLIVLGSLGTLAGMPWQTNPDTVAVLVQLVGIALSVAVGVVLVWISMVD